MKFETKYDIGQKIYHIPSSYSCPMCSVIYSISISNNITIYHTRPYNYGYGSDDGAHYKVQDCDIFLTAEACREHYIKKFIDKINEKVLYE